MAFNIIDFSSYVSSLAPGNTRYTYLPLNPFLRSMPASSGLFAEVSICTCGSSVSTVAMSKFYCVWKFSSTGVLSTDPYDRFISLVGTVGSHPVDSAQVFVQIGGGGDPRVRWQSNWATRSYTIKGQVWGESTS